MSHYQTPQRTKMNMPERQKILKRKLLSSVPYKPEYEEIMDQLLKLRSRSSIKDIRQKVSQHLVEKIYIEMSKAQRYFTEKDPRLENLKRRRKEPTKKKKSFQIRIKHRKEIDELVQQHIGDVRRSSSTSDEETDIQKFLEDFTKEMRILSSTLGESILEVDPKDLLAVVASRTLLRAESEAEKEKRKTSSRRRSSRRPKGIHARYLQSKRPSAKADSKTAKRQNSIRRQESHITKKELGKDLIVKSATDTSSEIHEESRASVGSKKSKSKRKESYGSLLENTISLLKQASFMQKIKEREPATTPPHIKEHDNYFSKRRSKEATKRDFTAADLKEMDGRLQEYEYTRDQDNVGKMSMNSRTLKTEDRRNERYQGSSKTPPYSPGELKKQLQTAGQLDTKIPWSADQQTSDQSDEGFKSPKTADHRYGDQRTQEIADRTTRDPKVAESADRRNGDTSEHWEKEYKLLLSGFDSSDRKYHDRDMSRTRDDRKGIIKSAQPADRRYGDGSDHWEKEYELPLSGFGSYDRKYRDRDMSRTRDDREGNIKSAQPADRRYGDGSDHWEKEYELPLSGFGSYDRKYSDRDMSRTRDDRERNIKSAQTADRRYGDGSDHWEKEYELPLSGFGSYDRKYRDRDMSRTRDDREGNIKSAQPADRRYGDGRDHWEKEYKLPLSGFGSYDRKYHDRDMSRTRDDREGNIKSAQPADRRYGDGSDHWEKEYKLLLSGFSSYDRKYRDRDMSRTRDDRERNIKSAQPADRRDEDRDTPKTTDDMERYFKSAGPPGRKYVGRRISKNRYHNSKIPTLTREWEQDSKSPQRPEPIPKVSPMQFDKGRQVKDTKKQLAYQKYPKTHIQSPTESDRKISDSRASSVKFSLPEIKERSREHDFKPPQKADRCKREEIQPTRTDRWYPDSTKRRSSDQWEERTPQKPEHWYPREGEVTLRNFQSEKEGCCASEEEYLDTPGALKRAYNISVRNEKEPWKIRQTTIDDVLAAKGFYPFIIKTQLPNTYYWRLSKARSLDDTEPGTEMPESKPDLEVKKGAGKCEKPEGFLKKKGANFLEKGVQKLKEKIAEVTTDEEKIYLVPKAKRRINNINTHVANLKNLNEIENILQLNESKLNTNVKPKRTLSCYNHSQRLGGKVRRIDEEFESTLKVRGDFKEAPWVSKYRESIRERLVGKVKPQISVEMKTEKERKPDPKHVITIKLFGADDRRPLVCET